MGRHRETSRFRDSCPCKAAAAAMFAFGTASANASIAP
ncbi:MAG: hypothetical protein AVDCRST_MAG91-3817 [uncultured Sphingomonadaceae bacterium]|uniref:Uncharacterized protein n=1 Tax=uncultured Sphingomonadaceae bacterium TaxID=169976 RepID=A0A6J4U4X2_9SPHN|nr:MAG: hypothetical protein AVDCRST_MAG91-3817 [uncultured Sphingomonadaceae bacterium]